MCVAEKGEGEREGGKEPRGREKEGEGEGEGGERERERLHRELVLFCRPLTFHPSMSAKSLQPSSQFAL